MKSTLFSLNLWDLYKGVITGTFTTGLLALLIAVQGLLSKNGLTWTMDDVKGLILSNLETLVENSEDIKKRNYDIIIKIIDEMFDNPKTKEEFIRHLSGGCSVPRIPQLYVHSDKKMTPEEQHKKELQEGSDPLLMMKKMGERKFPVALGGSSNNSSKKNKRNNTDLHHKTRKQTKK